MGGQFKERAAKGAGAAAGAVLGALIAVVGFATSLLIPWALWAWLLPTIHVPLVRTDDQHLTITAQELRDGLANGDMVRTGDSSIGIKQSVYGDACKAPFWIRPISSAPDRVQIDFLTDSGAVLYSTTANC